jgi:hypothetical protein
VQVEPELLPHWKRVAFAARCARRVRPLFDEAWPEATAKRVAAIDLAITLAERSAAKQHPCDGLKDAVVGAIMVAGRALIPYHYPVPVEDDEPGPPDSDAALVASFAAKVAEKAADAAAAAPGESGRVASEAYHFALNAIRTAGRLGLVEVLEADFEVLSASAPRRPWWRLW